MVEEVQVALSVVPAGVQCVRVTATNGGTTVTAPLLSVTSPSSSANLTIGQLATGSTTFNGAAFNIACASVTSSTVANWTATPVTMTLVAGLLNQVTLTFVPNNAVSVNANFVATPVELALSPKSSRLRMADGTIREWGATVGNGVLTQVSAATGISDAVQVSGGGAVFAEVGCARRAGGGVSCWGAGLLLGVPPGNFTITPVALTFPFTSPVAQLSIGGGHACAMQINTTVCWGDNSLGQFGNGSTTSAGAPVQGAIAGRVAAGGSHTCIIASNGTVGCTGSNASGQLGLGTTTNQTFPQTVAGLSATTELALGLSHSCALRADGTVRCWGLNGFGQLGDGTNMQRLTPVQVTGLTDAVHIAAGANHTCAQRQTGAVSCWGNGSALGDGVNVSRTTPADVPGLTGVVQMDTHLGNHVCAILGDRSVKCWGENDRGQIDFSFVFAPKPTAILLQ